MFLNKLSAQSPCDFTYTFISGSIGEVQFNSTFTAGCIEYEEWNLGDGTVLKEVSNPLHLYLSGGNAAVTVFTVTHIVKYQGVTYPCVQYITVNLSASGTLCSDRYFSYDVDGCTLTMNSTLAGISTPVDVTISFGDDSPPVVNVTTVSHSYLTPGTYNVTQTYILYDEFGNVSGGGSCIRPVTVGCCCEADPLINVSFDWAVGCETPSITVAADICCGDTKCRKFTIKVGDNPEMDLSACTSNKFCITNYSTYGSADKNFITITYHSFCHGQPVDKVLKVKPPFDGIFLGLNPLDPYNCDPDNTTPNVNGGGFAGPGDPSDKGCKFYYSQLSQYLGVLESQPNTLSGTYNVFVAPGSIIEVDHSFTFIGNIRINMAANSGWDVLSISGNQLMIRDGVRMGDGACCLWRGVNVYGRGTFNTQCAPIFPDNNIANALYAVRMFSIQGQTPRLLTRNTVYNNNFVAIRGTNGKFNIITSSQAFRQNTFTSSGLICINDCLKSLIDFIPQDQYQQGNRSFAGMLFIGGGAASQGIVDLTGFSAPAVPDGQENRFINLANGVVGRNLNLTMEDCASFDNMAPGGYLPSTAACGIRWSDTNGNFDFVYRGLTDAIDPLLINGLGFNNCPTGMFLSSLVPGNPSNVKVTSCRMTNMGTGVFMDAIVGNLTGLVSNNQIVSSQAGITLLDLTAGTFGNIQIKENALDGTGVGINVSGSDFTGPLQVEIGSENIVNNPLGIRVGNYSRSYIHENTVSGISSTSGNVGIFVVGGVSEIECNNISNKNIGIWVSDNIIHNDLSFNEIANCVNGVRVNGACPAENFIKCNTLTNSNLWYSNMAVTGPQNNTGNTWVGSAAQADFTVDVTASKYSIPPGTGPNPVNPVNIWFVSDPFLQLPNCTKTCMPDFTGGGGGGHVLDEGIAGSSLSVPDGMRWKLERYLYRQLDEYPALEGSNPVYQEFLNSNAGKPLGLLGEANRQTAGLFSLGAAEATVAGNRQAISTLLIGIAALDQQVSLDAGEATLDALYAQIATKTQDAGTLISQNTEILHQAKQNRIAGGQVLFAGLKEIAVSQTYEVNEKAVLGIYLQTIVSDILPDAGQLNNLYSIAIQCPQTGGPAVYFAAALWQACTGQEVQPDDCEEGLYGKSEERGQVATDENSPGIKIYPNPVNNWLTITTPNNCTISRWDIYDTFGRTASTQSGAFTGAQQIATGSLQGGVYYLRVTAADGTIQSLLFTVQH